MYSDTDFSDVLSPLPTSTSSVPFPASECSLISFAVFTVSVVPDADTVPPSLASFSSWYAVSLPAASGIPSISGADAVPPSAVAGSTSSMSVADSVLLAERLSQSAVESSPAAASNTASSPVEAFVDIKSLLPALSCDWSVTTSRSAAPRSIISRRSVSPLL